MRVIARQLRECRLSAVSVNSWLCAINALWRWSGKDLKIPRLREEQKILDYLRFRGLPCYKHQNAGIRKSDGSYIPTHTRGVSDIIGCIPNSGRFLAIEVKRPVGKPTAEQQQHIDTINEAGGLVFVARSTEEVITSLHPSLGGKPECC